jgi:hypothetical protein
VVKIYDWQNRAKEHSLLPLKPSKVSDVKKLVDKYVPREYKPFYDAMHGNDEASSETDESEGEQT